MAATITIANQKGGVGKTTTTFNIARAAQTQGINTLVIDMDPQGNLTSALSAQPLPEDAVGVADALEDRAPQTLGDVVIPTIWDRVTLAPTVGEILGYVRDQLVIAGAGRESRLKTSLQQIEGDYDLVLIDCAPSLDQLTTNALVAADEVLIVTHPSLWSTNGLAHLLESIEQVKNFYSPNLHIGGVVINHWEASTLNDRHWKLEISSAITDRGLPVLEPAIPKRAMIKAAAEAQMGLDQWGEAEARKLHEAYVGFLGSLTTQHA